MPKRAETKVVVVSTDTTPSTVRRMRNFGVEGYLTKPVDVAALLRLVDRGMDGLTTAGGQCHPDGPAGGNNA